MSIEKSYIFDCIEVWYTPEEFGPCAAVQPVCCHCSVDLCWSRGQDPLALAREQLRSAGVEFEDLGDQLLIDVTDYSSPVAMFTKWFGGEQ